MNGKSSRRKGHDFERLVVRLLRELGADNVERHLEYQPGQGRYDVSYDSGDRQLTVSCKTGKQVPVEAYRFLLCNFDWERDRIHRVNMDHEMRLIYETSYQQGCEWITKALGGCDELWLKRPGWPIVVVSRVRRK